jgi:hypothetical protein
MNRLVWTRRAAKVVWYVRAIVRSRRGEGVVGGRGKMLCLIGDGGDKRHDGGY